MKVIFLDIDGVLNSGSSAIYWGSRGKPYGLVNYGVKLHNHMCPIAVSNLNYIMEQEPDARIVITSTWRKYDTLPVLREIFTHNEFRYSDRIIDVTENFDRIRGKEIKKYVAEHIKDIDLYVIVDDDSDMEDLISFLVQTNGQNGLSWTDTQKILERLKT